MLKRLIILTLPLLLLAGVCEAEWKQVQQGDTTLCVSDTGQVARCTLDEETGKLLIGAAIVTRQGQCPT